MVDLLDPSTFVHLLACPHCSGSVHVDGGEVRCADCRQLFSISDRGIAEFVTADRLDAETSRELEGNTYRISAEEAVAWTMVENQSIWDSYYGMQRTHTIRTLSRYLEDVDVGEVFFLGVGTGRDILFLSRYHQFETIYASDLSISALRIAVARLQDYPLALGLFTADLAAAPIGTVEKPVFIVNALHHTEDMHAALERLLQRGHRNLFLVEPADNFLVRFLAQYGYARRIEYSGVKPGRLNLKRLQEMARQHDYELEVTTHWNFPEDYYNKLFPEWRPVQKVFLGALHLFSRLTAPFSFGNSVVVHLQKRSASAQNS